MTKKHLLFGSILLGILSFSPMLLSVANKGIEPLMTKVTRFLGIEHTCKRISLLTAVSLIYQAIPVVPTVFDDWI
ncbi:TPA: hypothetical protein ACGVQ9_002155 [Enterococcus faecium]